MASVKEILNKIGCYDEFNHWQKDCQPIITRKAFFRILMDPMMPPIYETSRTVSEKWSLLQHIGLGVALNSDAMRLKVADIRYLLDIKTEEDQ